VSVTDFVRHDGKVPESQAVAPPAVLTFADLKQRYLRPRYRPSPNPVERRTRRGPPGQGLFLSIPDWPCHEKRGPPPRETDRAGGLAPSPTPCVPPRPRLHSAGRRD
jgi:hypothetical protein